MGGMGDAGSAVPSGLDLFPFFPALKRRAIFRCAFGTIQQSNNPTIQQSNNPLLHHSTTPSPRLPIEPFLAFRIPLVVNAGSG
jgi:hypothetical protein